MEKPLLDLADLSGSQKAININVAIERLAERDTLSPGEARKKLEAAYLDVAEATYGKHYHFWAQISEDGMVRLAQVLQVVADVTDEFRQVDIRFLKGQHAKTTLGDFVVKNLNPIDPPLVEALLQKKTEIQNISIRSTR